MVENQWNKFLPSRIALKSFSARNALKASTMISIWKFMSIPCTLRFLKIKCTSAIFVEDEKKWNKWWEITSDFSTRRSRFYIVSMKIKFHSWPFFRTKRDFICKVCGKTLTGKFSLKKHEILHLANNPAEHVQCPICQKTFKRLSLLKQHRKIVHDRSEVWVDKLF